jgi:hypothetical protein
MSGFDKREKRISGPRRGKPEVRQKPLTPRCYSDLGGAPAITDADVEGLPARYENRGKARNVNRGEK